MRYGLFDFYATAVVVLVMEFSYAVGNGSSSQFGAVNMTELGMYAEDFLAGVRGRNESESISFRLRTGVSSIKGCGFRVQADGNMDSFASLRFPAYVDHSCQDGSIYVMRTTSPNVTYDKRLRLSGHSERVNRIEVHADSFHVTYVNTLCVGLHDWINGHRAVCVNNRLLDECGKIVGRPYEYINASSDIPMSRTRSAVHKIVFRELKIIVESFQRLVRNTSDRRSQHGICDYINLVEGAIEKSMGEETHYCEAERKYITNLTFPVPFVTFTLMPVHKNPDDCASVFY